MGQFGTSEYDFFDSVSRNKTSKIQVKDGNEKNAKIDFNVGLDKYDSIVPQNIEPIVLSHCKVPFSNYLTGLGVLKNRPK